MRKYALGTYQLIGFKNKQSSILGYGQNLIINGIDVVTKNENLYVNDTPLVIVLNGLFEFDGTYLIQIMHMDKFGTIVYPMAPLYSIYEYSINKVL